MRPQVRSATPADAAVIGAVLARAFANDPVTSWVTREVGRRARVLERMNTLIARYEAVPRGAAYVVEDGGRIVGAAIWQPPHPQSANLRRVPFALRAGLALGRDIPRMTRSGWAAARARPPQRHWYLQLLGIDPDAQGSGAGSALVRNQLPIVDAAELPVFLETTVENLPFYGRLGFEVIREIRLGSGAPMEYSLRRMPR